MICGMSAIGTKRTCRRPRWMSAFGGKADIQIRSAVPMVRRTLAFKGNETPYAARSTKNFLPRKMRAYTAHHDLFHQQ